MSSSWPLQDETGPGQAEGGGDGDAAADMALSLLRRRTADTGDDGADKASSVALPGPPPRKQNLFPITFLLSCLLLAWCCSVLVSGSFFHVCVSSRKLRLYCISGGAARDVGVARAVQSDYVAAAALTGGNDRRGNRSAVVAADANLETEVAADGKREETAKAVKVVEQKLELIRSWAAAEEGGGGGDREKRCDGGGIFVYDLPSKFNRDLMDRCRDLLPWTDLCPYLANDGKGEAVPSLGGGWYRTHQYALEPILHRRALSHPCRVHDPGEAQLFYVPFYGGLDILRWHFQNVSTAVKDELGSELVRWLEERQSRWWARNGGKDHIFVLGKISWDFRRRAGDSWGSNFLELPQMEKPFKFLIERQPWMDNDIGIPHPTYFHPRSDDDVAAWQDKIVSSPRRRLVGFAGAGRPGAEDGLRSALIEHCTAAAEHCEFLDCARGGCSEPEKVTGLFLRSEFCLQPPGDSPTRKSVFDGLVAGCIPVLFDPFTAYYQYPWHLPEDHRRYSVFVDKDELRASKVDVVGRLRRIPAAEREDMRRYIAYQLMPTLVYGDAAAELYRFHDAFDVVMNNMMKLVNRSDYMRA